MRAMRTNGKIKIRALTLSLLMGISPTVLMAQDTGLLDDTEAVVNSEEIYLYPDDSGNPNKDVLSSICGHLVADRGRHKIESPDLILGSNQIEFWQDRQ